MLIALGADGRPSFGALQNYASATTPVLYFVFDVMIVSGRVSQKMAPILRTIYDQMPEPKWVISMGACASTGGVFNNYALLQGVDKIVPVDVYIPGCPPRPEDLLNALMILQERIKAQGILPRQ